jgi:YgiT-type zinc finger domain-containing protein
MPKNCCRHVKTGASFRADTNTGVTIVKNSRGERIMSDQSNYVPERYTCPECQAGILQLEHITYLTWLAGELITVPDFPAWICDVCGRCDYDPQAISWLNILLNAGSSHHTRPKRRRPRSQDQPPAQP